MCVFVIDVYNLWKTACKMRKNSEYGHLSRSDSALRSRSTGVSLLTRVTGSDISKVVVSVLNFTFYCTVKILCMFLFTFWIAVIAVVVLYYGFLVFAM